MVMIFCCDNKRPAIMSCPNSGVENNVNNLKDNMERTPRRLAQRKTARSCEPSSNKLSSQLSSLFPIFSVADGDTTRTFTYHADGQLASATVGAALRADRGRVSIPRNLCSFACQARGKSLNGLKSY
jgi:hypothetical protein